MPEKKIQEIEELLGKKMLYEEGLRLKAKLEARYNVTITAVTRQPATVGPKEKMLIFSDYTINR